MKEAVQELSKCIDSEAKKICEAVQHEGTLDSEVFENAIILSEPPTRPHALVGRKGVYVFIVTKDITLSYDDVNKWNTITGASFFFTQTKEIHAGDCLYLGSCISKSKSLYSRLREHFSADGTFTALKLNNKKRSYFSKNIKVYAFPIKKEYSDWERKIIVPSIEKRMHEYLSPKTGSSRT